MAKYKAKVNTKEVEKNTKKKSKKEIKTIKSTSSLTDDQIKIRSFIITLIVMIILVVGLYFLSVLIIDKKDNKNTNTTKDTEVEISYDIASVGMILNRPYNDYYVMVYDSTISEAMYYSSLITGYMGKENSKKIYFTDLSTRLNKAYASGNETGNKDVKNNIDDFSFGKVTLLHIKDNTVVNYYEDITTIEEILK